MSTNPYQAVDDFENAVAKYTGAPFAVAVDSCTHALFLCCVYHQVENLPEVIVPSRTYVSVPAEIIHAGGRVTFKNFAWVGEYQLQPTPIWDSAKRFTKGMHIAGRFQCISFHFSKILNAGRGGMILHDDPTADKWFREARFSGRHPEVSLLEDKIRMVGWHFTLDPVFAVQGLMRLSRLSDHNEDQREVYPDLSRFNCFSHANREDDYVYAEGTTRSTGAGSPGQER